jgi:transcriptional regulator with XRE-family HTH domain
MTAARTPKPVDKHVGSRVRMRRRMLDMSQTALGEALGVTFQQVQKYEKGTNRISASRLQQIANLMRVTVTFFFEGAPGAHKVDGGAPSPTYVNDFVSSSDGLRLIKAFSLIENAELRRRIVDLVHAMVPDSGI